MAARQNSRPEGAEVEPDYYCCRPSWIHHPLCQAFSSRQDRKEKTARIVDPAVEGTAHMLRVIRPLRPGFSTARRRAEAQPH
jgi:hypothetical protein